MPGQDLLTSEQKLDAPHDLELNLASLNAAEHIQIAINHKTAE